MTTTQCKHYWYLERSNGRGASCGRCVLCGEEKEFANSVDTRLGAARGAPQTARGTKAALAAKRKAAA